MAIAGSRRLCGKKHQIRCFNERVRPLMRELKFDSGSNQEVYSHHQLQALSASGAQSSSEGFRPVKFDRQYYARSATAA